MYKKDNRYGPGVLRYPNKTEDVGFWCGEKLVRLIVPFQVKLNIAEFEAVSKQVELVSWYDRESLLFDTLNPQNLFLNRVRSSKSNKFIKDDPYIEKVIQSKKIFYNEFIDLFARHLDQKVDEMDFKTNKLISVYNLTPNLLEIFKNFKRFSPFHQKISSSLDLDIKSFEECKSI